MFEPVFTSDELARIWMTECGASEAEIAEALNTVYEDENEDEE